MSDLVRNPEDRFSHNEAQIVHSKTCFKRPSVQVTWKSLLTGGCLLLNERKAESYNLKGSKVVSSNDFH